MSYTANHLYFDDLAVGQEWQSPGRTVTQADIVNFAGVSGDFNPIHMDHEYAKNTVYHQAIAHGLLVFSMGSGLGLNSPPLRTLAFTTIKEWHFRAPVFVGDTIHGCAKVLEIEPRARGRRGIVTWQKQLFNQAGKVVQEGVLVVMIEGRAAVEDARDDGAATVPPA